ncbi:GntR family transcriptional regulator [Enteractinococcus helveticum]|uniref:GntR family transcriptional regulator n=1 Tax=Enteractinococcus helveticum TaxID=1837282 RepID=A0A1B7M311_9MICC|nr:GntR family transcriptional regulator [Enteractinococcus helveticum]OAV62960.1 GntR family transcriptional regulator [Enteractinococcus helveticum]
MITLSGSTPPADQIRDQIRGLIVSGRIAANDRLPSVRQLAKDLNVAPGTVAKAYKALESEGFLIARTGGGTRVSPHATTTPRPVLDAARHLAGIATDSGTSLDETIRIVRAIWPERQTIEREAGREVTQ